MFCRFFIVEGFLKINPNNIPTATPDKCAMLPTFVSPKAPRVVKTSPAIHNPTAIKRGIIKPKAQTNEKGARITKHPKIP